MGIGVKNQESRWRICMLRCAILGLVIRSRARKGTMPLIFGDQSVGGNGDPNNGWTVNGFSWEGVSTTDYWVPEHCFADGDEYPLCSLKRSTAPKNTVAHAVETGQGIIDNRNFIDFSVWYADTINLPHDILTHAQRLLEPSITSYDPIWYLFHSMVSYHQA